MLKHFARREGARVHDGIAFVAWRRRLPSLPILQWGRREHRLKDAHIALHLSEVKGPVMDVFSATPFMRRLGGKLFLTHFQAIAALIPEVLDGSARRPESASSSPLADRG